MQQWLKEVARGKEGQKTWIINKQKRLLSVLSMVMQQRQKLLPT